MSNIPKFMKIRRVKDIILYDRKTVKWNGIITLIVFILMVITGIIFFYIGNKTASETAGIPEEIIVVCMSAFPMLALLFLRSLAGFLDGVIYLRDLKRKGFIIPDDAKDFDKRLSLLPCEKNAMEEGKIHVESLIMTILFAVVTIITFIYTMVATRTSHPVVIILMCLMTAFDGLKIFNCLYKNRLDIDVEDRRFIRRSFQARLIDFIVLCFCLFIGIDIMENLPTYRFDEYERIISYCKEEYGDTYRYYMDELPEGTHDGQMMQAGTYCTVRFYVPREDVDEVKAYFENINESIIIHTPERVTFDEAYFSALACCNYFEGRSPEDCIVYEYDEWVSLESGYKESWYAIVNTRSGEVACGRFAD